MVEVIQPLLAPAILFSAGGLLCMAQFARLTAVIAQVRTFDRERLEALHEAETASPDRQARLLDRAQGLEHQAEQVLAHANTIRHALRFLVGGILLQVLCSFAIGGSLVFEPLGSAPLALFVLGLLSTFVGLCLVMAELGVSLDVVRFEHENLTRLRSDGRLLPAGFGEMSDDDG